MSDVSPIPVGCPTLTPHLVVDDAIEAIKFYKKAFGAEELACLSGPDGKIMHAEMRIGDSRIMLCDEFPQMGTCQSPKSLGGTAVTLHLWSDDVDVAYERAVEAGAEATMPPMDAFWGDRYGKVLDPFGHQWSIASRKQNLTPEQIREAAVKVFAGGSA